MTQTVNWEAALEYVGGDEHLLREVLRVFLEECPRWLAELDRNHHANDAAGVQRAAHKFKGALRNFGAEHAGAAAAQIEAAGKSGALTDVDSLITTLKQELERVLPAVRDKAGRP
jgi:HPt (histidine-containing phosphotransfer) domain-containing protein